MNRYKINIIGGTGLHQRTIEANSHRLSDGMILFFDRAYHNKEEDLT